MISSISSLECILIEYYIIIEQSVNEASTTTTQKHYKCTHRQIIECKLIWKQPSVRASKQEKIFVYICLSNIIKIKNKINRI